MLGIQYYRKVFTFHLSHNAEFAEFLQLDWHFDKKGENGVKDMLKSEGKKRQVGKISTFFVLFS